MDGRGAVEFGNHRTREAETWPAEKIFDVRWAATAVEHALRRLGEECEARGRRRVFDVLSDCLAAERARCFVSEAFQNPGRSGNFREASCSPTAATISRTASRGSSANRRETGGR